MATAYAGSAGTTVDTSPMQVATTGTEECRPCCRSAAGFARWKIRPSR
ncbi:hypothetical protein I547_6646 [Mycobacterium kansasii 824]|uniref:Uncharacterized protein n=1 Tax=Mycobacterium kansasii TaxID=1768 RepID=A0A1V3XD31_MYCKA|nr:hypothetical protein I547_6646 [Mycobacterium kansasii 824]OOK77008.1 hypothetical protein BZL29_3356 [Mycobacterium kansasii]